MRWVEVDDEFEIKTNEFYFDVKVLYVSEQILKFRLRHKEQVFELQRTLLKKTRHPYQLLEANFEFKNDKSGERMEWVFYYLDDYLFGTKPRYWRVKD